MAASVSDDNMEEIKVQFSPLVQRDENTLTLLIHAPKNQIQPKVSLDLAQSCWSFIWYQAPIPPERVEPVYWNGLEIFAMLTYVAPALFCKDSPLRIRNTDVNIEYNQPVIASIIKDRIFGYFNNLMLSIYAFSLLELLFRAKLKKCRYVDHSKTKGVSLLYVFAQKPLALNHILR